MMLWTEAFFPELFKSFFIAMGVLLGGSLLGGLASFAMGQPLFIEMWRLSNSCGSGPSSRPSEAPFDTVYSFEKGFLNGETKELFKQFLLILAALGGPTRSHDHQLAHAGACLLMRIPPFYRLPSFQRFFAGAVIGGIVSWMIFIFMYGSMHEKQTQKIQDQQTQLDKLTSTLSYLQEENKELNEENEDELTIQEVR